MKVFSICKKCRNKIYINIKDDIIAYKMKKKLEENDSTVCKVCDGRRSWRRC